MLVINRTCDFNPLPRKEGDSRLFLPSGEGVNFNPLPRKEGDNNKVSQTEYNAISIHSLVKRETSLSSHSAIPIQHFNPLPRKEGDRYLQRDARFFQSYFNPLPRKEGDKSIVPLCALSTHFNPLPRKEGDFFSFWASSCEIKFQSTPS